MFGLSLSDLIQKAFEHLASFRPRLPPQAIKRFITARWPVKVVRLADLDFQYLGQGDQRKFRCRDFSPPVCLGSAPSQLFSQIQSKRRYTYAVRTAEHSVSSSTLRVRRHRERRRERLHLFTVEVPEDLIDEALARGLLKPEDRADWWAVIQACYAAQLSDVALDWLTNGGVDIGCWEHGCWS